jgi:hypothetical protein
MAVLRKKTKAKKAQLEASAAAAEARRAAEETAAAIRDLGQALLTQLKDLELDEKAVEALDKLTSSDAYVRGRARAAEVGKRLAENDNVAAGRDKAAQTATAAAAGLGSWLAAGRRGEALGIAPAKRRGGAGWFLALVGVGIGYGIGILTAPKEGREIRDQLSGRGGANDWDSPVTGIDGDEGVIAPAGDLQLADKVRTRLGEDPRTSELPSLNINVVDGTVVVRGPAPDETDEDAIRDVVGSVDGVREVDLELGPAR